MLVGTCALAAGPVAAQTGLLIVSRGSDAAWNERIADAASRVRWPHGPTALVLLNGEAGDGPAWEAALGRLASDSARAVVVAPVGIAGGDDTHAQLRYYAGLTAPRPFLGARSPRPPSPVPLEIAPVVSADAVRDADHVARAVERAAAATRAAMIAGGLVTPGQRPSRAYILDEINVTATRRGRASFATPAAVTVLGQEQIRARAPNTATDLFRDVTGLDVAGVGTTQPRPIIRGLEGQRILLLEDGLRLNNSRRRQASGETLALVDISNVERVEVVRGASSVLYGSDAIGGVVNLVPQRPIAATGRRAVSGTVGYRYGTAGNLNAPRARVTAHLGDVALRIGGSYRHAEAYEAPDGAFGDVSLGDATPVHDTGVRDYSLNASAYVRPSRRHSAFIRFERYSADEAGFGYVDPADYAADLPTVQILFPTQTFTKLAVGYEGTNLWSPPADRLDVTLYWQGNNRLFVTNVTSSLGLTAPPDAELRVNSESFTDLDTYGFRLEAMKTVGAGHLLTYGADLFRDRSINTDTSTTTIVGLGPPSVTGRGTPRVPNATLRSLGIFAQGEVTVTDRATVVLGARYQDVRARTRDTPGLTGPAIDATDRTVVGAANLLVRLVDEVNFVASLGRGFRSPNLVERFFDGPSPEGRGVWIRNAELDPETSFNVDVGFKLRSDAWELESFAFRNTVHDGIRIAPTGREVDGVPEFQNVNIDELRFTGVEAHGAVIFPLGMSITGGLTHLVATSLDDPDVSVGESYSNKWSVTGRYTHPTERLWIEYGVRHNGERADAELGASPVGAVIPSFTVHTLRAAVRAGAGQRLGLTVGNLTNALYAEAPNVSFFRPEPQRHLVLSWEMEF